MPPHEKRIVDVKFAAGISHFVTVTLDEVSPAHGWRDGLPAGYIALSFIAVSKWVHVCSRWGSTFGQAGHVCSCAYMSFYGKLYGLYWQLFAYGSSRFLFSHLLHNYFYHSSNII
ncbi:hypothetical protein HanLR1_Chr01g0022061 [Helianthus annuus]|nr:hypothetical protein HanLR1_Chr01g0022061 [Helianthus annuus]